jgi:LysM repeat protein
MTPEERRNWNANKPGAKPSTYQASRAAGKTPAEAAKAANPNLFKEKAKAKIDTKPIDVKAPANRPTLADLKKNEAKGLEEAKARVAAKNKALANSAKGKTQTPQAEKAKATTKPEGKAKVAKKGSRTVRATKFIAKKFPLAMLAGEVVSTGKGSTFKDLKEINRLKAKLGNKPMSAKEGAATQASNLANLATMGLVGKTRRQRMDELNAKVKKQEAAQTKANKKLRYGKGGESLVPGTAAYKAGSKTRPSASAASTKPTVGSGGSTTKYTVKKGDTLSGIAKSAGLTLAEVRSINPELMKNPKYKKGSTIWSGTKVNIKKK